MGLTKFWHPSFSNEQFRINRGNLQKRPKFLGLPEPRKKKPAEAAKEQDSDEGEDDSNEEDDDGM